MDLEELIGVVHPIVLSRFRGKTKQEFVSALVGLKMQSDANEKDTAPNAKPLGSTKR